MIVAPELDHQFPYLCTAWLNKTTLMWLLLSVIVARMHTPRPNLVQHEALEFAARYTQCVHRPQVSYPDPYNLRY